MITAEFRNVLSFVLLFICCAYLYGANVLEGFSHGRMYLLGDSVLDNTNYVANGKSVYAILHRMHGNVVLLAKDNSRVSNLEEQMRLIGPEGGTIVISAGGNDILGLRGKEKIVAEHHIDEVFDSYKAKVGKIASNTNCKLRLLDVYRPPGSTGGELQALIQYWNHKLWIFARENGYVIVPVSRVMRYPADFVSVIEPSEIGSEKIAHEILAR